MCKEFAFFTGTFSYGNYICFVEHAWNMHWAKMWATYPLSWYLTGSSQTRDIMSGGFPLFQLAIPSTLLGLQFARKTIFWLVRKLKWDFAVHLILFTIDGPIRLTHCCTQLKSPWFKILCVLYYHHNVVFILNDTEIPWKKGFIPKGFELGTTLSKPMGLLETVALNFAPLIGLLVTSWGQFSSNSVCKHAPQFMAGKIFASYVNLELRPEMPRTR